MNSIDKYLVQALDNYPFNLEDALTSLEYALSYNNNNPQVLCLYGRFLSEQLRKYDEAKAYYQQAIQSDLHAIDVYPFYLETLLKNEDFEEAKKLIAFALTIKGINKFEIKYQEVILYERIENYKQALKLAKKIMLYSFDQENKHLINDLIERIKQKRNLTTATKKKK